MPTIIGLPRNYVLPDGTSIDLSHVPDSPTGPHDELREAKCADWTRWRDAIGRFRTQEWIRCERDVDAQAQEMERCRRYGSKYFLTVWGWMYDPRLHNERPIGPTEFIPYPFQVDLLDWLWERPFAKGAKADGIISKSRDMGATWCACGDMFYGWLFGTSFQGRLISRKEELVDRKGDMDAMFTKIDFMLDRIPLWMLPHGFNWDMHRMQLRLLNPENRNAITGEATTSKTLRGGRATKAIYDELAFISGALGVWATGANATGCRIGISTESVEEGDDFVKLRQSAEAAADGSVPGPALMLLHYWLHPEHGPAWLSSMKDRFGPDEEGFEREVLRNPHGGFGNFIYKEAGHISVGNFPYEFGMPVYVGMDPGLNDLCGMVAVAKDPITGRFRCVEAFASRGNPPEYYASLLLAMPDSSYDYLPTRLYNPHDWMALMRQISDFTLFGDPAGHNRNVSQDESWYSKMQVHYAKYHPFGRGLPIVVNWNMKTGRSFQARRMALMKYLPLIDFNDTPGVRALLDSLKAHKFERQQGNRMNEPAKPFHGDDSHIVAGMEYIFVNLEEYATASVPTPGVLDAA